jgi:hypothetical protein
VSSVTRIGVDRAKNDFQLHAFDVKGDITVARKLARRRLVALFVELPLCCLVTLRLAFRPTIRGAH